MLPDPVMRTGNQFPQMTSSAVIGNSASDRTSEGEKPTVRFDISAIPTGTNQCDSA